MPEIILYPVVDSLDGVAESHRDLYESRDGKFVMTKPVKLEDVSGLRSALESERGLARELAAKQKDLPPDVRERLQKAEALERKEQERNGEYQKLLQSSEEKYKVTLAASDVEKQAYRSELTKTLVDNAATTAINAAGGSVKGLLPHVMPELRAIEDPKKPRTFSVFVIDPKDPETARLNEKGEPMTVEELIAEKRADEVFSRLFSASPASGSGGQGNRFQVGAKRVVQLTAEEAKDPRKYEQLKDQKRKGEIDGALLPDGRRLV